MSEKSPPTTSISEPKADFPEQGKRFVFFVTSHGFGHAARASAVITALRELDDTFEFDIYTSAPRWFFENSLPFKFGYHTLVTDIGCVQESPFGTDLQQTQDRLDRFLPFDRGLITGIAEECNQLQARLIVCDIAPMGIAVANEAGIPSLLVENFTWDWIYDGYRAVMPSFKQHAAYLKKYFDMATYHIQTEPICRPDPKAFSTKIAARKPRTSKKAIRQKLKIPPNAKIITLTLGGVPGRIDFRSALEKFESAFFIIPGSSYVVERHRNVIRLPQNSDFFHPDLIQASDAVVGKAGYSTIAEVYHAGIPFGHVARSSFREAPVLSRFIRQNMTGLAISETDLLNGNWIQSLKELLSLPTRKPDVPNGADQIAAFINNVIK